MVSWADTLLDVFSSEQVTVATHVPDGALIPLIAGLSRNPAVACLGATREDEAVAIAAGAAMTGSHAVVMMQSSGFGNIANTLASLVVPYQIPLLLVVTERGILGEFNPVQTPITRVIRPTLDALGIPHVTLERPDEVEFLARRVAIQAFQTQSAGALILSPALTGGKTRPGSAKAA